MASAILRETAPVELGSINGPDSMTTKAEIMNFLKGSFSYLHKAVTSINEKMRPSRSRILRGREPCRNWMSRRGSCGTTWITMAK